MDKSCAFAHGIKATQPRTAAPRRLLGLVAQPHGSVLARFAICSNEYVKAMTENDSARPRMLNMAAASRSRSIVTNSFGIGAIQLRPHGHAASKASPIPHIGRDRLVS